MPISETSFDDRLGRSRTLRDAIDNFEPEFAPSDADNSVTAFASLVAACEAANSTVESATVIYSQDATARVELVLGLKLAVTRALAEVNSNSAWKVKAPALKMVADALRGVRPPPVKVPAGAEPAKKRNRGDQSYEDIRGHLTKWVAGLTRLAGYAPTSPEITLGAFNATLSTLRSMNDTLPGQATDVTDAVAVRGELFDGPDGLRERMKLVKLAVKSQYGAASTEYGQVRGIRV